MGTESGSATPSQRACSRAECAVSPIAPVDRDHCWRSRAVTRDAFSATAGIATYVAGGTNHDRAKRVMLFAGFPVTDSNVTVFTRWMRQENGADDWFNRNNPINNGGVLAGVAVWAVTTPSRSRQRSRQRTRRMPCRALAATARSLRPLRHRPPQRSSRRQFGHPRGLLATTPTAASDRVPRCRSPPPPRALGDS